MLSGSAQPKYTRNKKSCEGFCVLNILIYFKDPMSENETFFGILFVGSL
jgi:hypothetical protein